MSAGHRLAGTKPKSDADLYRMLGEGDTPKLYARHVRLVTDRDVPYAGGSSVDGRDVFIDRTLYRDIMSGKVAVRGMSADQVAQAVVEHEHTEWAVDAGDNPVDSYGAAHEFAEAKEDRFVRQLGVDPERYEAALEPALKACERRRPEHPPRTLWCGPYVDNATPHDREILRQMQAKGVTDASKQSKIEVHYGIGSVQCRDCKSYENPGTEMSTCAMISGIVRANRSCDEFVAKGKRT